MNNIVLKNGEKIWPVESENYKFDLFGNTCIDFPTIETYVEEDDEIVLLDYKTDAINSGEELVQRYKTQLDYYRKALENIKGMKVKVCLLYAFRLDETIEVR